MKSSFIKIHGVLFLVFNIFNYASSGLAAVIHPGTDGQCYAVSHTASAMESSAYSYIDSTTNYSLLALDIAAGTAKSNGAYGLWYVTTVNIWKWEDGSWSLLARPIYNIYMKEALLSTITPHSDTVSPTTSHPSGPTGCSPCSAKQGQSNYKLDIRSEGVPANLAISCYEDCKTTAVELWEDCVSGQCVSSIKHTFTGEPCSGQPAITDLEPTSPERCNDEINAKISACGGSLNVQTFNFENCTGTCTPDSCSDAYALKIQSCGGVMAIATWDDTTCKGTCVSDPLPPEEPGPTDKPPVEIKREEVVNSDGSKEVTRTTTQYNSETNTTYTTTTTTTYNSNGEQTGQTSSTTITPGKPAGEEQGEEEPGETFGSIGGTGFGEPYSPGGEYDIPTRFNSFLNSVKSSGLFSFSSGFFNSIPGGGSPMYTINGGQTFGSHSIDLSETMTIGLAVLKTILMACFGFLSIRAIIMKR